MNFKYFGLFIIVLGLAALFFFKYAELEYNIKTKAIVYPYKEWQLSKTDDGTLINVLKNNLNNRVSHYSVTEFQRGDFAEFIMNDYIMDGELFDKGDTIGFIRSNEQQRRYLELKGKLVAQQNLLKVYASGEKPEDIDVFYENILLAEQEYNTQKKITERDKVMHQDGFISDEEYEISLNKYKIKLHRFNIARSEYNAAKSGEKYEQLQYIKTNIDNIREQLNQVEDRISSFNILAPFSGVAIKQHGNDSDVTNIITIADISKFVFLMPIELYDREYVMPGQKVMLTPGGGSRTKEIEAKVVYIDNSVKMINFHQNIFVIAAFENQENISKILPNMVLEAEIKCGRIPAGEYIKRLFKTVYQN